MEGHGHHRSKVRQQTHTGSRFNPESQRLPKFQDIRKVTREKGERRREGEKQNAQRDVGDGDVNGE